MTMEKFIAVWVKEPELPLFKKKLKVDRIEKRINADSIKNAIRKAKLEAHPGFDFIGITYET